MAHTAVVADDHGPTRINVRQMLELAGWDVIGEAADAAGTVELIDRLRPTVVVLDVHLTDGTGIAITRTITARPGSPRIVLMSTADYASVAHECGAHAFIRKDELSIATLTAAIR
jgi:DNA-binding NarL/FixJ family response regulator